MKDIFAKFNRLLENRIRLAIMSALVVNESIDYNTLRQLLGVTDGNLASHIKTLENNKMVNVMKITSGKRITTHYSITDKGKKAFEDHLDALEKITGIK